MSATLQTDKPKRRIKWWMWALIAVGLLLICGIIGAIIQSSPAGRASQTATAQAQETEKARPTDTPRPADTPRPTDTPVPPTNIPSPEEALAIVAQGLIGKDSIVTVTLDSTAAFVEYDLGTQWDENSAVRTAIGNFVQLAPQVFADFKTDLLVLDAYTDFTDVYGKTTKGRAFGFIFTRAASEKINWPEFDPRNVNLVMEREVDCSIYIHPALRPAWDGYVNK